MKVVINKCYGGFSVSLDAARFMADRGHDEAKRMIAEHERDDKWIQQFVATGEWPDDCPESSIKCLAIDAKCYQRNKFYGYFNDLKRNDTLLVEAVEALGEKANGECANLGIVEVPDDVEWEIADYDGNEHVAECHRTWG